MVRTPYERWFVPPYERRFVPPWLFAYTQGQLWRPGGVQTGLHAVCAVVSNDWPIAIENTAFAVVLDVKMSASGDPI
jgi:hypothetical protein